jgi:hypothetical protein
MVRVLDEPGWRPLIETYKQLLPHARTSTALEVMAKLKSGELPCRRWPAGSSQCEPVQASFWQDCEFDWIDSDRLYIYGPDVIKPGPHDPQTEMTLTSRGTRRVRYDGNEFYVLEAEKVWLVLATQATKENAPEEGEPLHGKTGPRATHNWQMFVTMTYCTDRYNNRGEPTAPDLADACGHEFGGWKPATTAINKLLRELRKILG